MQGEEDSDREIRAMVLLTLPYPPLPLLAARVELDDGRLHDDGVTTSHTLLAKALSDCAWRNDPAINAERRGSQRRVLQEFLHVMAEEGFATPDPECLYRIYCAFTIKHLATYLPPGHPMEVRFQPLSYIVKGDRTHQKLAEYMAAQSIFFEDPVPITREQFLQREPKQLLFDLRARLGHVMTPEERDRAGRVEEALETL
jgi:hypothetical protein